MPRRSAILGGASQYRARTRLRVGWGGNDGLPIAGVTQDIQGAFMARSSWVNLANGDFLDSPLGSLLGYKTAHPNGIATVGTPLIPHDSTSSSGWNALLDSAISGAHDADYTAMGSQLALNTPKTCYCRLWWEFNMISGADATKFKAAWARAVPLIRAGFAGSATSGQTLKIVMCSMPDRSTKEAMYPGGAYVDVVSYDVYGKTFGTSTPTKATAMVQITGYLADLVAWGKSVGKPVALDEWANWQPQTTTSAVNRGYGDWPEFITAVFDWATNKANNVEYLTYFNESGGDVGTTLDDQPLSKPIFVARTRAVQ